MKTQNTRRTASLFFGVVLTVSMLSGLVAHAQTRQMTDESSTESTTLEQRVQKRKQAQMTRPTEPELARVRTLCKASQAHLARLSDRLLGISVRRERTYDALIRRLTNLSDKLEAADADTTELDKQISELQTKVEAFYASLHDFQTAVNDLATMDCVADPEGYKLSLEDARTLRAQAAQASQAIQTYLKDTIKATLITLRSNLHDQEGEANHGG